MARGLFLLVLGLCVGAGMGMSVQERIVLGKKDLSNEHPYSCWIEYEGKPDEVHCGAVLVAEDLAITLAECLYNDMNVTNYGVVLGDKRIRKSSTEEIITPLQIILHPYYSNDTGANNIAWIRLSTPAGVSKDNIGIVTLAEFDSDTYVADTNGKCVLSSFGARFIWGGNQFKQSLNIVLQDDSDCSGLTNYDNSSHFCHKAKKASRGYKACYGDKGSPILCKYNGNWVLVGLEIEDGCSEKYMSALETYEYNVETNLFQENYICEGLPDVDNGYFYTSVDGVFDMCDQSLDFYMTNATAELVCDNSYVLSNEDNIISCENSSWSTVNAECLLSCGPPNFDGNGTYNTDSELYILNSTAILNCSLGYVASSDDLSITCEADGNWTTAEIECLKTCGEPSLIDNGYFNATSELFVVNDNATLYCNEGYVIDEPGNSVIECTEQSGWTNTTASCLITCGFPDAVDNGNWTLTSPDARFESTADLTCEAPYVQANENVTIECQADGNWTAIATECVLSCGEPDSVSNGYFGNHTSGSYLVNETATLHCNESYLTSSENVEIVCKENGTWTTTDTVCLKICDVLSIPDGNVTDVQDVYLEGDSVTYECDEGFIALSNTTANCDETGTWTINGTCETTCGEPDSVSNGYFGNHTSGSYLVNETATLHCNESYLASSENVEIICQGNGTWTTTDTVCLKICDMLLIPNGNVTDVQEVYLEGDSVTYECDEGFIALSNTTANCDETGTWTINGTCETTCGEPDSVPNGYFGNHTSGSFLVNETATLNCNESYLASSENVEIVCQGNGTWTTIDTVCLKICDVLSIPDGNVTDVQDVYLEGDSVTYECDEGFIALSNTTANCDGTGTWTINGTCELTCGEPDSVSNGYFGNHTSGSYLVNETATLHCNESYLASSENVEIVCQGNGTWTTTDTVCLKICDVLSIPDGNVTDVQDVYLEGDSVTYECDEGFIALSNTTANCDETGIWTINGTCETTCGEPDSVSNGYFGNHTSGSFLVNETATLNCNESYLASSENVEIVCQENGTWTTIDTVCLKICDVLSIPDGNVTDVQDVYLEGDSVTYECDEGFIALSNTTANCDETGTWTINGPCETTCGEPDSVSNGYFGNHTSGLYLVNETATLNCNESYLASSENVEIFCQGNGTWTTIDTVCLKICDVLSIPDGNVTDVQDMYLEGDSVTYECDEGFIALSNTTANCDVTGTWTINGTCETTCGEQDSVPNGYFGNHTSGLYLVNETATLNCNESYLASSENVEIVCQGNGTWTTIDTVCLKICDVLSIPDGNVTDVQDVYLEGDSVTYECDEGFIALSNTTANCDGSGTWTINGTCETTCGVPDSVSNGYFGNHTSGSYLVNETATLHCNESYLASSENVEIVCQENGTWTTIDTVCLKVCDVLSIPDGNVTDVQDVYLEGDSVTYECDEGFIALSNTTANCDETGTWTINGTCETTCGEPDSLPNGYFGNHTSGSYLVNETATLNCNESYLASSENVEIVCQENGTWTTIDTVCLKVCDVLLIPDGNVTDVKDVYLEGDSVTYECDEGFIALSNTTANCDETGTWTINGTCEITCEDPVIVVNGTFQDDEDASDELFNGFVRNETATLICDSGYEASSSDVQIECLADGNWTTIDTECLKECDPLPEVVDGVYELVNNNSLAGIGMAMLVCDGGYRPSLDNITCTDSGTWTGIGECVLACGVTPPRNNGRFIVNGTNATLECDDPYEMWQFETDESVITCLSDIGRWSYSNNYCILPFNLSGAEGPWLGNDSVRPLSRFQVIGSSSFNAKYYAHNAVIGGNSTWAPFPYLSRPVTPWIEVNLGEFRLLTMVEIVVKTSDSVSMMIMTGPEIHITSAVASLTTPNTVVELEEVCRYIYIEFAASSLFFEIQFQLYGKIHENLPV